ncbi:hypothetical protein J6G99_04185 [bacterium]|nr:hypothetical protein [bacterium]
MNFGIIGPQLTSSGLAKIKRQENSYQAQNEQKLNSNNNVSAQNEMKITHDENSKPLTSEQQAVKDSARQQQLADIEVMKRANKTIVTEEESPFGGYSYTIETKYDSLGREEKIVARRNDGTNSISSVKEFKNGVLSKDLSYSRDNNLIGVTEYDSKGNMLSDVSYDSETGKEEQTKTYEYYPNGNLKFSCITNGDNSVRREHFENGQVKCYESSHIEEKYDENTGTTVHKRVVDYRQDYNEQGNLYREIVNNNYMGYPNGTNCYYNGEVITEEEYKKLSE